MTEPPRPHHSPAVLPQWTARIGRVTSSAEIRDSCGRSDPATGATHNAKGDRLCSKGPACYRVRLSCPGHPHIDRMYCVSCAAEHAARYGHAFPPGLWVDTPPAAPPP